MSVLLSALIDACEADLDDSGNTTWSAADIEQWCRDAIADYSQHFTAVEVDTISCSAADQQYDLSARLVDIITVEYPTGQTPPEFLEPRPLSNPRFWEEDGYYAVLYHNDDADPDELLISTSPSAGESIDVTHTATYDNTIATNAAVTVPIEHHHILRNYVVWRAVLQLKAAEEASPTSNSSLLMSQLAINVDRARRAYTDSLAKALFASSKSAVVSWKDQDQAAKRIY